MHHHLWAYASHAGSGHHTNLRKTTPRTEQTVGLASEEAGLQARYPLTPPQQVRERSA
jgi:hypothetical protein